MNASADWPSRARRAAFASHRLVGWIFWDPAAIAGYASFGVPNGMGYYIATRGAPLAAAGHQVVTAAFGSTHPDLVRFALDTCATHTAGPNWMPAGRTRRAPAARTLEEQ